MFSPDPANAPKGYSKLQIILHWVVALLIISQFLTDENMGAAFDAFEEGGQAAFDPLVGVHLIGGIAVLLFAVWRITLRRTRGFPAVPQGEPAILRLFAHLAHLALYALLLAFPITGLIAWFGVNETFGDLHGSLEPILIALVALHVVAALWHQFWLKDGLMERMKRPLD